MKKFLLYSICPLVLAVNVGRAAPIEWASSVGGNGHLYNYVYDPSKGWHEARLVAESYAMPGYVAYLATITSAQERDWVYSNVWEGGRVWLGGFQNVSSPDYSEPSGAWEWVTGEPWLYTNWNTNEPNEEGGNNVENFLETWFNFAWNDTVESAGQEGRKGYIVEYTPVPEPSSLAGLAYALSLCTIGVLLSLSQTRFFSANTAPKKGMGRREE